MGVGVAALLRVGRVPARGSLRGPVGTGRVDLGLRHRPARRRAGGVGGLASISRISRIVKLCRGSDTDVDVRLAATRALGNYQGLRAVEALSFALDDPNPALQIRATESLARATGESIGRDVQAWQRYVKQVVPPEAKADAQLGSGTERMVENNRDDSINQ